MGINRRLAACGALAALALGVSGAGAAVLTSSPWQPPATAISNTTEGGTLNGSQDYTDNGGPPGQTFTPATNVTLSSFIFRGGNNAGGSYATALRYQVGQVDAATGAITQLSNETVTYPATAPGPQEYLHFKLATPVSLTAGTTYSLSLLTPVGGYYGLARSVGDSYAGGTAFNNNQTTSQAGNAAPKGTFNNVVTPRAYDYVFYINPVPEPASLGVLAVGALGLLARRRRA